MIVYNTIVYTHLQKSKEKNMRGILVSHRNLTLSEVTTGRFFTAQRHKWRFWKGCRAQHTSVKINISISRCLSSVWLALAANCLQRSVNIIQYQATSSNNSMMPQFCPGMDTSQTSSGLVSGAARATVPTGLSLRDSLSSFPKWIWSGNSWPKSKIVKASNLVFEWSCMIYIGYTKVLAATHNLALTPRVVACPQMMYI